MRRRRGACAAKLALLLLGLLAPRAGAPAAERVTVLYPAGGCPAAARLEIEVWERPAEGRPGRWKPHPEHPWIAPGSCQQEDPGILLNEIRLRCADPSGERSPSEWIVGVDVAGRADAARCPAATPSPASP